MSGIKRMVVYEQPRQELAQCCFSFERYPKKFVNKNNIALYGNAIFVSLRARNTNRAAVK